jgi:hypothetical protein
MLNNEPVRALDVVSRFIGLADFKWQDIVGSIRNTSFADTVCLKVLIFSHFAQFEGQIAFNRIELQSMFSSALQEMEPMEDVTRTRLHAFFRHFGTEEYDAAKRDGYTGCEPNSKT